MKSRRKAHFFQLDYFTCKKKVLCFKALKSLNRSLAQLLGAHAIGAVGLRFDSWVSQIGIVSPTVRHCCDVPSELCNSGAKPVVLKLVGSIEPNRCHASTHRTLNYNQERIQKILERGCSFELG